MSKKRALKFLTIGFFLIFLVIRLIHLTADPPYNLSTSGGPYGDPGGYSFNARNKILFGKWEVDNYNMMYVSFPPHLATYLSFKSLGIGFAQMNLVPVIFSWLTLLFFFLILKEKLGHFYALLGAGLLGCNYLFLMYSRIANRIMPALFFMTLGIYFLQKGKKKPRWLFAAGASFALALLSKSVLFYALGGVLVGYLVYILFQNNIKETVKQIGFLFFGSLIPILPWFFFIYAPHRNYIQSFSRLNVQYLIPPKDPSMILKYFWVRPDILIQQMPVISLLAALFSLALLYKVVHTPKNLRLLEWIFLGWFITGFIYFAVIQQRVTRHFIPLILPMIFLTASLAQHFLSNIILEKIKRTRLLWGLFLFLWMLFPVSQLIKWITEKNPQNFLTAVNVNFTLLFLSLLCTILIFVSFKFLLKKEGFILSPFLKKALILSFVVVTLVFQGSKYLAWAARPPYQLKNASQDFGKAFDKAVFAGLWAPVVCLENKHRAHEYFQGIINDRKDFFEKYGITHVFTTTAFQENVIFERNFPHVMKQAKLLARYHIWTVEVLLYDVDPDDKEEERGFLEAEIFTQKGSMPRFDKDASNGFAVLSTSRKADFVILAQDKEKYTKGNYEVTYRIKKHGEYENPLNRIARLDVISEDNHKLIAYKDIFLGDLSTIGYQDFTLPIHLKKTLNIKFRVYTQGKSPFWIDWIKIKKTE